MKMNKYYEIYEPEVTEITSGCSPVSTGTITFGGWVWYYPAIGKVAGTAGNLEKWVTGYKEKWESLKDSSVWEESFNWSSQLKTREEAWEWLDSQAS